MSETYVAPLDRSSAECAAFLDGMEAAGRVIDRLAETIRADGPGMEEPLMVLAAAGSAIAETVAEARKLAEAQNSPTKEPAP